MSLAAHQEAVRCNASLLIAKRSTCPSGHWQDLIAQLLVEESHRHGAAHNLTMVNVGANKVCAYVRVRACVVVVECASWQPGQ